MKDFRICANCNKCQIVEIDDFKYQYFCLAKTPKLIVDPENKCQNGIWIESPEEDAAEELMRDFKEIIINYIDNPANDPKNVISKEEILKEWEDLHPQYIGIFYHEDDTDYTAVDIENHNFLEFYDNCRMNIYNVVEIKDGKIVNPFTGEVYYA